jgi:hypothetical protein
VVPNELDVGKESKVLEGEGNPLDDGNEPKELKDEGNVAVDGLTGKLEAAGEAICEARILFLCVFTRSLFN